MSKGLDRFARAAEKLPVLSLDAELALARAFKSGDAAAGNKLVCANLRFAMKKAHEYARRGFEIEDLVQEANLGLMLALERFDPKQGVRFVTYARFWIMARCERYCALHASIAWFNQSYAARIEPAVRRLLREGMPEGEAIELAATGLGIREDRVRSFWFRRSSDVQLDAPLTDGEPTTHLDLLASPLPSPEQAAIDREQEDLTLAVIRTAAKSPREMQIVERRIIADEPATLADVGDRMGLSRERVRQLEESVKKRARLELVEPV